MSLFGLGAKAKQDRSRTWTIILDDAAHLIQIDHAKKSGVRTICVDGAVQLESGATAANGRSRDEFTIGQHILAVVTTPAGASRWLLE